MRFELEESIAQLQDVALSQRGELDQTRELIAAIEKQFPAYRGEIGGFVSTSLDARDRDLRALVGAMEPRFVKFAARAEEIDAKHSKEAAALAAKIAVLEKTLPGLVNQSELGVLARVTELAGSERKTRTAELVAEAKSIRSEVERQFKAVEKALKEADHRAKGFAQDAADTVLKKFAAENENLSAVLRREFEAKPAQTATPTAGVNLADVFKGIWSKTLVLSRGDLFTFLGSTFIVLRDSRGVAPTRAELKGPNARYAVFSAAGANGITPDATGGGAPGAGTVTSVSVVTANGVSGSVANATSTPAITLALGAITPASVAAVGAVTGSNLSGTNTGDQTSVSGNAGTATALQTSRTIGGISFNGTADIAAKDQIGIACSDETTAITAGNAKATFRMPFAFTLTAVKASVTAAPTGSTILIDINEGVSSILSTKLMIDASSKTSVGAATPYVISDASLADDAEITIDFDQVGSTIAGAGVKVWLIGTRA